MPTPPDIIEHKLLGAFRRTGERRVPLVGEYYYSDRENKGYCHGIAICTQPNGYRKEILEPLNARTVELKTVRGGL